MLDSYKKTTAQPTPCWIAVHGQIGTAHINRDGAWVNFRPARKSWVNIQSAQAKIESTYVPAKGVEVEILTITYRIVTVDYRAETITGTDPKHFLADGNPPQTIVVPYDSKMEIWGFPIPTEIVEEWKEDANRRLAAIHNQTQQGDYKQRITERHAAYVKWADGLTGQERRWMRRFLTNGKAEQEIIAAAQKALPEYAATAYRVIHELRKEFNREEQP